MKKHLPGNFNDNIFICSANGGILLFKYCLSNSMMPLNCKIIDLLAALLRGWEILFQRDFPVLCTLEMNRVGFLLEFDNFFLYLYTHLIL